MHFQTIRVLVANLIAFGWVPVALGASMYKRAHTDKQNLYLQQGAFYGGAAQRPSTLLEIRSKYSANSKVERVVLAIGDKDLKPLNDSLGPFHVAIEKQPKRIVVDLGSVAQSKLNEQQIKKSLAQSPFVKDVIAIQDPEDNSLSLILNLKKNVALEVLERDQGRLVLDLKEVK